MNITLDTPLRKLFFKTMINFSCFLRLNCKIHVLMLGNIRGYKVCLLFFPDFINTKLKTRSRKYDQDASFLLPVLFSYFFINTKNRRNKYRNTNGMEQDYPGGLSISARAGRKTHNSLARSTRSLMPRLGLDSVYIELARANS